MVTPSDEASAPVLSVQVFNLARHHSIKVTSFGPEGIHTRCLRLGFCGSLVFACVDTSISYESERAESHQCAETRSPLGFVHVNSDSTFRHSSHYPALATH